MYVTSFDAVNEADMVCQKRLFWYRLIINWQLISFFMYMHGIDQFICSGNRSKWENSLSEYVT